MAVTTCPVGDYVVREATFFSDRVCTPCPEEYFGTEENQLECEQCTRCPGKMATPCTATEDRSCASGAAATLGLDMGEFAYSRGVGRGPAINTDDGNLVLTAGAGAITYVDNVAVGPAVERIIDAVEGKLGDAMEMIADLSAQLEEEKKHTRAAISDATLEEAPTEAEASALAAAFTNAVGK
jgi:hypothetical protein